jgi:hypothetical protein
MTTRVTVLLALLLSVMAVVCSPTDFIRGSRITQNNSLNSRYISTKADEDEGAQIHLYEQHNAQHPHAPEELVFTRIYIRRFEHTLETNKIM